MRIAILGTRGIPNRYGGFEQLAEFLSQAMVQRGHQVWVYNSSEHPYRESEWNGVQIVHCYDPEKKTGTAGQFIYDLLCILHLRKLKPDVILQLGYTSSSIWNKLLPRQARVVTNMDGLEWKRSKYNRMTQAFLRYAEKLAVRSSHRLVADATGIQDYLKQTYNVQSDWIAYGAEVFKEPDARVPAQFKLKPFEYFLAIARFEPENNIETIIRGYLDANSGLPLLLIGNHQNGYGTQLKTRYAQNKNIIFHDPVYDLRLLNNLRYYSALYFHGHSAGGTNPSLLEAMASQAFICAHNNIFNKGVLQQNALYFDDNAGIAQHIRELNNKPERSTFIMANLQKIASTYSWNHIFDLYEKALGA